MNNWYVASKKDSLQGLIVEEGTGKNVAVSYETSDAELIAAAPELMKALEDLVNCPDYKNIKTHEMRGAINLLYRIQNS